MSISSRPFLAPRINFSLLTFSSASHFARSKMPVTQNAQLRKCFGVVPVHFLKLREKLPGSEKPNI